MRTVLFDLPILDPQWAASLEQARASHHCRPACDSRPHFTSLEAATSEPMICIAEVLRSGDLDATRREIARFVQDGMLSEFHELNFYALVEGLAASRGLEEIARLEAVGGRRTDSRITQLEAELADHQTAAAAFLDGALHAASTPHQRVVAHENRASLALMKGDAHTAVISLIAALRVEQTETLWANLLLALERVGAMNDLDHVLDVLGTACTPRLLSVISEEDRDFDKVRERPAYRRFLAKARAHVGGDGPRC